MNNVPESLEYKTIYHGMIGKDFITAFNENFNKTETNILSILGNLIYMIKSEQIKGFRLNENIIQYTTDNEIWHDVNANTSWGTITGDISLQLDLKNQLDLKAAKETVDSLQTLVNTLDSNVLNLAGKIDTANTDINKNKNDIATILLELDKKVNSTTIKEIRWLDNTFQWTPDNINWYTFENTNDAHWGNITGDLSNQADLYQELSTINQSIDTLNSSVSSLNNSYNTLNSAINELKENVQDNTNNINSLMSSIESINQNITNLESSKANSEDLFNHVNNFENPHNVNKENVGLGNVDNTADLDKPISNPQSEYINSIMNNFSSSLNATNIVYSKGKTYGIGIINSEEYYSNINEYNNSIMFVLDDISSSFQFDSCILNGTSDTKSMTQSGMEVKVEEVEE